MPPQPPYVNRAYWTQLALFNGGFDGLFQRFTVAMSAPEQQMRCSMELFTDDGPGWVELEGPIWQGALCERFYLCDQIGLHVARAQEYLQAF